MPGSLIATIMIFSTAESCRNELFIQMAENKTLNRDLRANAIDFLCKGERKEYLTRILKLLDCKDVQISQRVILAALHFKDPIAIPELVSFKANARRNGIKLPGFVNAALFEAIRACETNRVRPRPDDEKGGSARFVIFLVSSRQCDQAFGEFD